jgi:hypothetical protein
MGQVKVSNIWYFISKLVVDDLWRYASDSSGQIWSKEVWYLLEGPYMM